MGVDLNETADIKSYRELEYHYVEMIARTLNGMDVPVDIDRSSQHYSALRTMLNICAAYTFEMMRNSDFKNFEGIGSTDSVK